ncbi:hypothetical protein FSS13T_18690 [Flavobacterium saliperosum S13]|uniref:Uncharacterized protein n=2 Tax=Flavobacterium saliperosum TaxID=329186 RepID=A0A1G4W7Q9_9FLAO|nr:hypothetical protein [Flavobacterium saliperosum]ESU24971.1 hypothetical protein FSS13T_18690 [Flavobacterium saliperosum S13]SCX18174.1 hypothetical protein SAMN02927925_02633 [Flavobacterium saliperosum]
MIKLNKKTKDILIFTILFLFSFLYFFLAYIGFKKQNINLNQVDKITSQVENRGIDYRHGSKGRKSKVFYIKLKDLDEKVGVYRMSKNYNDLISAINIQDILTVYYEKNSNDSENVNINLIQIERNGIVLLGKKEYENKESALIYIGLFFGVGSVAYSFYFLKRKTNLLKGKNKKSTIRKTSVNSGFEQLGL